MESFQQDMIYYKEQMKKGIIPKAYRELMDYIMELRMHFKKTYPEYFVSGSLYYGYMDMTYFSFIPESLKKRKLKIAIVFIHKTVRFEVWLGGYNKTVQKIYWDHVKKSGWDKYHIPSSIKGIDSIVECVLVENPDFYHVDDLTKQIEKGTMDFISDIETFLSDLEK